MLKQADVLAENFRPYNGKTRVFMGKVTRNQPAPYICFIVRFRTYRSAKRCSCLRYHHSGNERDNDGNRIPDAPPVRVGTSCGSLWRCLFIQWNSECTLWPRKEPERAHVDIAMFDATLSFLEHGLMAYIATGKSPQRSGNRHPYMAPFDVFDTRISRLRFVVVMTSFFCVMPHWSLQNWLMIPDLAAIFYAYKTSYS